MNDKLNYIGHRTQVCGVERVSLLEGRGKGMTHMQVRNGLGLNLTLSEDRCLDIARLEFQGTNIGYLAPCGFVSPAFCVNKNNEFLNSFTAGFMTTCGLRNFGKSEEDDGEHLPLHGTISSKTAENITVEEREDCFSIKAKIFDENLFSHRLVLSREYKISKLENSMEIFDSIENCGDSLSPIMILYHINFGYPMLDESCEIYVDSKSKLPRDENAKEFMSTFDVVESPTAGFVERCFLHSDFERGMFRLKNKNRNIEVEANFDKNMLDSLTQWNMFGNREYVLGLEPGNAFPDGRIDARKSNCLKFIAPKEKYNTYIKINFKNINN